MTVCRNNTTRVGHSCRFSRYRSFALRASSQYVAHNPKNKKNPKFALSDTWFDRYRQREGERLRGEDEEGHQTGKVSHSKKCTIASKFFYFLSKSSIARSAKGVFLFLSSNSAKRRKSAGAHLTDTALEPHGVEEE